LETLLWQYAMSLNLKSPLEGLKNTKCKKVMLLVRLPIPYVPLTDLLEKRETKQIKVALPDGTKFQTRSIYSMSLPTCVWSSRRE
jgi:hypothetical protein